MPYLFFFFTFTIV
jgi:hypothetical protein